MKDSMNRPGYQKTHRNNRMRQAIYTIMRREPDRLWYVREIREALYDYSKWCRRALGSTQQVASILLRAPGVERVVLGGTPRHYQTVWRLFDEYK